MTKVLYIGNYKDGTGWGNAALNNILAMDAVGIDVVPRCITYKEKNDFSNQRILELERQSTHDCDVCVQHTLPHLYHYDSSFKKNIGFLATETLDLKFSSWNNYASIMDELWVPSQACKDSLEVKKPIHVVPHSLNMDEYQNPQDGQKIDNLLNSFNFVFIGEFIERKNIAALIKAFHTEFRNYENVNLYIKTSGAELSYVQNFCEQIRKGLKVSENYKEEIVICGRLDKADYISTLSQCHSFVMPSRGEAFCIPALEAMSMGLELIYTDGIGVEDFAVESDKPVESKPTPCFGGVSTLRNLYTAKNQWLEIDVYSLSKSMRASFEAWKRDPDQDKKARIFKAQQYDHKNVGQKIKEILNAS